MPKAKKPKTKTQALDGPREELVALAVLMLRRDASSQGDLAREMYSVGFTPTRIGDLLGTTPNAINQAIQKGKRTAKKATKKGGRVGG